ncbi:MAG: TRAP transporter substrate-binding protein [Deltaproteobacteria bacterium]|nr:TRAP transporter substrate-binding protein [Deltaproteobacteria bacterium]
MIRKSLLLVCGIVCLGLIFSTLPMDKAFGAEKVIKLKAANFFPPPSKQSKILQEFVNELETRSKGRIKVQYFAGGSLLKAPAIYKGIEAGITDIGYSHVYYTPGRMPASEGAGLPMGVPSGWVGAHLAWDFYNEFKLKEWDKVKLLAFHDNAPSMIISKKPVRRLEDLKGLTIRAPGLSGEIVKALGATPAPTPMMEVYDAIAKGVVDGVWAPWETLKTFRFAEVAKYVIVCWQIGASYPFYLAMNKNTYNKLPRDLQSLIDVMSGEYQERYALMWNEIELVGKAFGRTKGMEYIELSDEEAARWKKAVGPVFTNYISMMRGKGFSGSEVKAWVDYMRERIAYWTKKQIEYKIPSPTGPAAMHPEAYVLK